MIHLDTNLLVDLVTVDCPRIAMIRAWIESGEQLVASSIAWSEFCNGPHTKEQKIAVYGILQRTIRSFDEQQAEQASRLYHYTGRRRGSHADCMIAAAAMADRSPVATRNLKDFERFVPYGLKLNAISTA